MPVSEMDNVAPIIRKIVSLNPKRTLDLGVGFGKYGALIREVTEAVHGRCNPDDFVTIMNGYEGFKSYKNPLWKLYNNVFCANFADEKEKQELVGYDLVIAIDSLEHLDKHKAKDLLQHLVAENSHVIVSVPMGDCPQGAVFGNELETHRASWYPHDFNEWEHSCLRHGVCYVAYIKGSL